MAEVLAPAHEPEAHVAEPALAEAHDGPHPVVRGGPLVGTRAGEVGPEVQVDGERARDLLVPRVEAEAAAAAQIGIGRTRGAARPARLQRPFQAAPDLAEAVEPAPDRPLEGGDLDVPPGPEPVLAPEEPDPPHREPAVEARLPAVDERRPVLALTRRPAHAQAVLDGDAGGGHRQAPVRAADAAVREVVERESREQIEAVGEAPPGLEAEVDVAREPGGRMPLEGKVLERRGVPAARHPHADGREDVDGGDRRQDGSLDEPVHRHRPAPVRRPAPEVGELDARAVGREAVGVVPQRRPVRMPHQLDAVGAERVARQGVRLADDPGLQVEAQGPVLGRLRPELATHGAERLRQEPVRARFRAGALDRGGGARVFVVRRHELAPVRLGGGFLDRRRGSGAVVVRGLGRRPGREHGAQQKPDEGQETVTHANNPVVRRPPVSPPTRQDPGVRPTTPAPPATPARSARRCCPRCRPRRAGTAGPRGGRSRGCPRAAPAGRPSRDARRWSCHRR